MADLCDICRCVVVVGNERGQVGVGCASAKEVVQAVAKAVVRAKTELVTVPLTKSSTFPHRIDGYFGAAKVMLRPASEGTGVIAGGAVRVVLELAGIKNGFGKQLGSPNPLNNARAALVGLSEMRTFKEVAAQRDMTIEEFMGRIKGMLSSEHHATGVMSSITVKGSVHIGCVVHSDMCVGCFGPHVPFMTCDGCKACQC